MHCHYIKGNTIQLSTFGFVKWKTMSHSMHGQEPELRRHALTDVLNTGLTHSVTMDNVDLVLFIPSMSHFVVHILNNTFM